MRYLCHCFTLRGGTDRKVAGQRPWLRRTFCPSVPPTAQSLARFSRAPIQQPVHHGGEKGEAKTETEKDERICTYTLTHSRTHTHARTHASTHTHTQAHTHKHTLSFSCVTPCHLQEHRHDHSVATAPWKQRPPAGKHEGTGSLHPGSRARAAVLHPTRLPLETLRLQLQGARSETAQCVPAASCAQAGWAGHPVSQPPHSGVAAVHDAKCLRHHSLGCHHHHHHHHHHRRHCRCCCCFCCWQRSFYC